MLPTYPTDPPNDPDGDIRSWLDEFGLDYNDVRTNLEEIDTNEFDLRGDVFTEERDAFYYLYEAGAILAFSKVYQTENGFWMIAVGDSP